MIYLKKVQESRIVKYTWKELSKLGDDHVSVIVTEEDTHYSVFQFQ